MNSTNAGFQQKNKIKQNENVYLLMVGPQLGIISGRWWSMYFCFALSPQGIVNHFEPLVTVPAAFSAANRGGGFQVCIINN